MEFTKEEISLYDLLTRGAIAVDSLPASLKVAAEALEERGLIEKFTTRGQLVYDLLRLSLEDVGRLIKLERICRGFIDDNEILSSESVYQMDNISLHSLGFVEDVANHLGYAKYNEDEDDEEV